MPSLGADMAEGTLVQWNVKPGDPVKRGDIIAVVGTEKADIEVEVYETGTLEKLIAKPGEKQPVGTPLAMIRVEGEAAVAAVPEEVPAMRHAIALAMARSNREIPHYYLSTQIDMSKALKWLEGFSQPRSIENRILPAALLLKAVARGLIQVPELNGSTTN